MLQPSVSRGLARPLGASATRGGINFAIFSKNATEATLVLFDEIDGSRVDLPLDPHLNKTGDVWHVLVRDIPAQPTYAWRFDRQPNLHPERHRYDPALLLLDPYALAVVGNGHWGDVELHKTSVRKACVPPRDFDWEFDQPLNIPLADSVIYEMHVRSFTRHASSQTASPGTFAGVIEKIPYLKSLGVTALELLPVNEFEECDTDRLNPFTGERLLNLWGYQPISFFAPNASYASDKSAGGVVLEFKEMVKQLHRAGIEVILDVVFNHTCEGDERGPTRSFRGIDNSVYYLLDPVTGKYLNYSGCGNTLNCNNPVVRRMISDCLCYWVTDMHVDGFRFDLASILGRGQDGSVLASPPLLEELAAEPVLGNTKLIAEAWDAAGLYQVGTFPHWGRWAEWNGKYRDDMRRFVRGDEGAVVGFAQRLTGSPDLYQTSAREPFHSINFITCHDGFTLRDLVSYNEKHNQENGENDTDGSNDNLSWNHGAEGITSDEKINALRYRQQKNFLTILMLSHGVPMLLAGDECGRTQNGNNNAYCQDNATSWLDWRLVNSNAGLVRFTRSLIELRKSLATLRRRSYNGGMQIRWHGINPNQPDWGWLSHSLACEMSEGDERIYIATNMWRDDLVFALPPLEGGAKWRKLVDTAAAEPNDIAEPGKSFALRDASKFRVKSRSVVVLRAF